MLSLPSDLSANVQKPEKVVNKRTDGWIKGGTNEWLEGIPMSPSPWCRIKLWSAWNHNTVGSVISRLLGAKILPLYLALSREGADSRIQDHRPTFPGIYNSQTVLVMLSDNRGTYVSRISTHIDIAPATNHNKQHYILIIMQQNCQITRCARQHTMDSVLKSAKLRRDFTGNRNGFMHARPALCGSVSPKLDERLGDKFANRISNN